MMIYLVYLLCVFFGTWLLTDQPISAFGAMAIAIAISILLEIHFGKDRR